MRSWFGLTLVVVAVLAGAVVTALFVGKSNDETTGGAGDQAAQQPQRAAESLPPIQGLKIEVDGLIYNVTDVRVLDFDSPSAAPYLTNLPRPGKGSAFLGVFMRIYNPNGKAMPSAPGFLLEPSKQPGLAELNK